MYKYERKICEKFSVKKNFRYQRRHGSTKVVTCMAVLRFFLACVLITVFLAVFSVGVSVFDKGSETMEPSSYDNLIWPIVMQDPKPFNESVPPDAQTVLRAALWDLAMAHKSESFRYEADGTAAFSELEVKDTVRKLFGKDIDFESAKNFCNSFYRFNDFKKQFLVEAVSGTEFFLPHTVDVSRGGQDIILKVGYVLPKNRFNVSMDGVTEGKIEKLANYRLRKSTQTGELYVSEVV